MYRYFLEISYDGTNYHGWQVQENAITVQQRINNAMEIVLKKPVETIGCGRTDAGVHASQFFLHFDANIIQKEDFVYKLNSILPLDISIKKIINVEAEAHSRFDATLRTYHYHIHRNKNPFKNLYSWYMHYPVDMETMNKACKLLIGEKDFKCFSKTNTQVGSYVCTIHEAFWIENEDGISFTISANRFLRNMVRAIVGTMIDIGRGKMSLESLESIIESKNRSNAGASVPAQGLFLSEVKYPYI